MREKGLKSAPKSVLEAYARLTSKRRAFALALPLANSQKEAARLAGYSVTAADKQAHILATDKDVRTVVDYLIGAQVEAAKDSVDRMIEELCSAALADPRTLYDDKSCLLPMKDWPDDIARAVSGIESYESYRGSGDDKEVVGVVRKVRFVGKVDAIDKVAKIRGYYRPEKHEVTGADGQPLVSLLEQITGSSFPVSSGKKVE